jgi:hypothetical protein
MTLIITVATADKVVQASDLRLTKTKGSGTMLDGFDDFAIKQAFVRCKNADLTVAYTGVTDLGQGSRGEKRTDRIILNHFVEISAWDVDLNVLLNALKDDVGRKVVNNLPLKQKYKVLTIALAGFVGTVPFMGVVTNFENLKTGKPGPVRDSFDSRLWWMRAAAAPEKSLGLMVHGTTQATDEVVKYQLKHLCRTKFFHQNDGETVANKLTALIRQARKSPKGGKYIGENCVSVSIPSDSTGTTFGTSHPHNQLNRVLYPHSIRNGMVVKDVESYHDVGQGPPAWWGKQS